MINEWETDPSSDKHHDKLFKACKAFKVFFIVDTCYNYKSLINLDIYNDLGNFFNWRYIITSKANTRKQVDDLLIANAYIKG